MIEFVLDNLQRLLVMFAGERFRNSQMKDLALKSLFEAVTKTKLYIQKKKRSLAKEEELVHLWAEAAIHIRHFDRDLAERCAIKSEYWINPNNFSNADVHRLRIGLDQVHMEVRKMI